MTERERQLVRIVHGLWSDVRFLRNVLVAETGGGHGVVHYSHAIKAIDDLPADLRAAVESKEEL